MFSYDRSQGSNTHFLSMAMDRSDLGAHHVRRGVTLRSVAPPRRRSFASGEEDGSVVEHRVAPRSPLQLLPRKLSRE